MKRPRRPILAALCAALLAATMALWVRGYHQWDHITLFAGTARIHFFPHAGRVIVGFGSQKNEVEPLHIEHGTIPLNPLVTFFGKPAPIVISSQPNWFTICIPLWFVTPFPAAGLWWSWRGPKAKAGFPLELAKETA